MKPKSTKRPKPRTEEQLKRKAKQPFLLEHKIPIGTLIKMVYVDQFYVITGYGFHGLVEKHQALEQNTGVVGLFGFGQENIHYEIIK